jgi:AcrR family transcriptional regulator
VDNTATKINDSDYHKSTRDRILAIATKHFAKHGYLGTSLEQVVKEAGVTRGALYHHFSDKHDLFRLVCHQLQSNAAANIDKAIKNAGDPWIAFVGAVHASLEAASSFEVRRILFVERVSVLSWDEWHAIDMDTVAGSLRPAMQLAMDAGYMERRPIAALFFVIAAAMSRITTIAADSGELTLDDIHAEFDVWLEKYRIHND